MFFKQLLVGIPSTTGNSGDAYSSMFKTHSTTDGSTYSGSPFIMVMHRSIPLEMQVSSQEVYLQ